MSWEKARRSNVFPVRIAWVWAMVFLAIIVYASVWFMFGYMVMEIISAIEASYTFTSPLAETVTLLKYVIAWHPIIAMFGWILWGFLNSMRRDVRTYEY